MKPIIAKAWACSRCGSLHDHSADGKREAAKCCTCWNCGEPSVRVRTSIAKCRVCLGAEALQSAEASFAAAEMRLDEAKRNAAQAKRSVTAAKARWPKGKR